VPTYQYACTACGHQLEEVQSFADDPLTQCPVCEGRLRKLFGSVGIVFKGPGFYRTDSRAAASNGNGGTSAGDKDNKDKKDKKPADGTESKPASPAGEKKSGGKELASSASTTSSATSTKS
jgi:putative FmdB family regulatory protein